MLNSNDIFREAAKLGMVIKSVQVDVQADWEQLCTRWLEEFLRGVIPQPSERLDQESSSLTIPMNITTTKHGSWLNMVEIELSVLGPQCLDQRLPSLQRGQAFIAHGSQARNAHQVQVHWRFTTAAAREKLHRLYPSSS